MNVIMGGSPANMNDVQGKPKLTKKNRTRCSGQLTCMLHSGHCLHNKKNASKSNVHQHTVNGSSEKITTISRMTKHSNTQIPEISTCNCKKHAYVIDVSKIQHRKCSKEEPTEKSQSQKIICKKGKQKQCKEKCPCPGEPPGISESKPDIICCCSNSEQSSRPNVRCDNSVKYPSKTNAVSSDYECDHSNFNAASETTARNPPGTIKPCDIIERYKHNFYELEKAGLQNHKRRFRKIIQVNDSTNNRERPILQEYLYIFKQQQKTFSNYMAVKKSQLTDAYSLLSISTLYQKCEALLDDVKQECKMFKKSLPIYAYKEEILSSVAKNQVTIISIDACYSASEIIPLFLHRVLKDGIILCCEPNTTVAVLFAERCKVFEDSGAMDLIGYDTEQVSENMQNAKILFTSVEKLFNESTTDSLFSNYCCILLHIDLKRNLETDFLLQCLRSCLSVREDVKVILLLSPLDDVSKFNTYFSASASVSVLVTRDIIFPVQTVWKKYSVSSDTEYIDEVVDTALAIHALNDEGDVLVFLPYVSDIKKVSSLLSLKFLEYNYLDTSCVPIYEDSVDIPSLGIPESSADDDLQKRFFFLTTSIAELLSLPSVYYVIDTGLRRDLIYDQEKGLDLSVQTFIAKATATQRRNYAGQFSPGTCYRLYSKHDYWKNMQTHEIPEVLWKNPLAIVTKLFQYRSSKIMSLSFVETVCVEMKEKYSQILMATRIIELDALTGLGERIVRLPYLLQYSKLIVIGIKWGFATEAVVLAAFLMVKKHLFICSKGNKELRQKIEAAKLHYIMCDSDTLTYLYIYLSWIRAHCSESWCIDRGIDYSVLVEVQSKAKEVVSVVDSNLNENVSSEVKTIGDVDWQALREILYDCFRDNLCVFTGHYRSGYRLAGTDCIAYLHPSSPVLQQDDLPDYVVFDFLKITSGRQFMIGVTAIQNKFVLAEAKRGIIKVDWSVLLKKELEPIVIDNVELTLIKQVLLSNKGRKLFQMEDQIKKEIPCSLIVIEPSEEKGTLTLYVPPECAKKAEMMIRHYLETNLEAFLNEEETLTMELKKGHLEVPLNITWQKGATAVDIKIGTNRLGAKPELSQTKYECKGSSVKYSVNLSWFRRTCKGFGFVSFSEKDFFCARRLSTITLNVNGVDVQVSINKNKANQLYIYDLPEETTNDDLKKAINAVLQEQSMSEIRIENAYVIYHDPFETTNEEIEEMHVKLRECIHEILGVSDFTITIPKPKNNAQLVEALINMDKPVITELDAKILSKRLKLNGLSVKAKPVYYSSILCSIHMFNALRGKLDQELKQLDSRLNELNILEDDKRYRCNAETYDNGFVCLKLLSNNKDVMNMLQVPIQKFLEGEVITSDTLKNLHKLFTHSGCLWLRTLEKKEKVFIIDEHKSNILRLYGSEEHCLAAYQKIKEYLQNSENEVVKCFDLSDGKHGRMFMKAVIRRYGFDLDGFIEDFNLKSAEINIPALQLIFTGDLSNVEKAMSALEKLTSSCSLDGREEFLRFEEVCCTCGMPPFQSSLRLERCGHLYCAECIYGLIKQAKCPPIKCCAEDCDKELILDDIHKGLDNDECEISQLLNLSIADYIKRNNQYVMYCPAPDCTMVFDKRWHPSGSTSKWFCPLCQTDICIDCNAVYHQGYTCDVYRKKKNNTDYPRLVRLKSTKLNCKQCLNCKSSIEKKGDSNQMRCISCETKFCGLCLTKCNSETKTQNHSPQCPRYN